MRATLAILAAAVFVAGCSSSGDNSSGSTGSGFTDAHDRCMQRATAACQHDSSCGYFDASQNALCLATFNCDSTAVQNVSDEQVDAGKAQVNASALNACVADITSAPCGESGAVADRDSTNCDEVVVGSGGQGDSCVTGSDCQNGFSCVRSGTPCGGTCQAWLTSGSCVGGNHPALAHGYYCGDDGGVIAQVGQGTACHSDRECSGVLVCVSSASGRTCDNAGNTGDGGACFGSHNCAPNFACIVARGDDGGLSGSCVPRGTVGDSCAFKFPDGGTFNFRDGGERPEDVLCQVDLFCDPTHGVTCQPDAKLGETCSATGHPACLEGTCINGTCGYADDGQPCNGAGDCKSGVCVIADGGRSAVCGTTCP